MKTIKIICLLLAIITIAGCSAIPKETLENSENQINSQQDSESEMQKENSEISEIQTNNQEDKNMDKPVIITFQMQLDEFLFLGIENKFENADMKSVWDNFFKAGGFEKIEPYQKKPYGCMVVYHKKNSKDLIYFIGSIVENIDKAPEGYSLIKFPACEFLVVTTEWLPTSKDALGENGLKQVSRYEEKAPIPSGYIRYSDGADGQAMLIERENFDTENGSRYEFWIPIKKES